MNVVLCAMHRQQVITYQKSVVDCRIKQVANQFWLKELKNPHLRENFDKLGTVKLKDKQLLIKLKDGTVRTFSSKRQVY